MVVEAWRRHYNAERPKKRLAWGPTALPGFKPAQQQGVPDPWFLLPEFAQVLHARLPLLALQRDRLGAEKLRKLLALVTYALFGDESASCVISRRHRTPCLLKRVLGGVEADIERLGCFLDAKAVYLNKQQ